MSLQRRRVGTSLNALERPLLCTYMKRHGGIRRSDGSGNMSQCLIAIFMLRDSYSFL